jgi:NAD-dependent dihydropyrimidine dehydrogenase PreA subunit
MARTCEKYPGVEWIDGAGAFIRVDGGTCTGCGNCTKVCLGECWEIRNKKATVRSLATCMECAACWYVCPEGAILFSWPPGGTGYRSDWG